MWIKLRDASEIKTLKGFGVSSCWWSPRIDDEKTADDIVRLLYGDDGLKLNIYRYNVGGGFEKDNLRMDNPWRPVESFMKKDGSYDWSADKNGVRVMKKALDTGNVDTLIFFANSPHFTQTLSGQTSGGFEEYFSNLDKNKYEAFAKYFIDIAEHFINEGYPVKYISPINEPQWKWGGSYVWQEGCHYEPEEVFDCFLTFTKELRRRNSPLRLYGPESGDISELTKKYYRLLSSDIRIRDYLDVFAYHSYGSDDKLQNKKDFGKWTAENIKKRVDMSEWCELPCRYDTKSIESAINMARIIGEDLIYSRAESWTAWVGANQWDNAVKDDKCYSDGLIVAKDDWSEYYIAMRYYALAHFSKYIPIGSKSLNIGFNPSRLLSLFAFKLPTGETALVAANDSTSYRTLEPNVPFSSGKIIETTSDFQLREALLDRTDKIHLLPKSVSTVILR